MIQSMNPDEGEESQAIEEVKPDDLSGDFEEDDQFLGNLSAPHQISLPKVVAIIIKTIIGAHIVLIPYVASQLGWALFIVVLIALIAIHHFTSILLLKCKNWCRHSNFYTIMHWIWPCAGSKIFCTLLLALNNMAFCVLQFMFIKISIVNMQAKLSGFSFVCFFDEIDGQIHPLFYKGMIIVAMTAMLQLPLILKRKIQKFKIFSILGVFGLIVFITTFIVYAAVSDRHKTDTSDGCPFSNSGFCPIPNPSGPFQLPLASISILILTLNFHMNFFPIYKGLKNPSDVRMKKASLMGLSATAVIYLIVGLLGYYKFGRLKYTNMLFMIDATDGVFFWLFNLSFLLSAMFNVVLMFVTCKNNFFNFAVLVKNMSLNDQPLIEVSRQRTSQYQERVSRRYVIIVLIIYLIIVILALFLDYIKFIFGFLGSLCSTLMMIILPCLFYIKIYPHQRKDFYYYASLILILIFVPLTCLSFYSTFSIDEPADSSVTCPPDK